ncbi:MAG: very short patch repair endonuclease [Patescibacteria group bacterium]|nr:very short patch repair endonuclease [Patescibacteria group bacterium]
MDNLTKEQRSYTMSRIKSKNTKIEILVFNEFRRAGIIFKRHYSKLPGKPDIAVLKNKKAVFIDSDFWHGWQYPRWKNKLNRYWSEKIGRNRIRDRKNIRLLRKLGWETIRIWGHQLERNHRRTLNKAVKFLSQ